MYRFSLLAKERIIILILLCLIYNQAWTQHLPACTALGQTPESAFPVCGTDTISQGTVSNCGGRPYPGKCGASSPHDSLIIPCYYSFTCFSSGTLGFVITPNDIVDNYNWQLFDITYIGDINGIFLYPSATIAYNRSLVTGQTGTSATDTSFFICGNMMGYTPPFCAMPVLIKGHQYLLMINLLGRFYGDTGSGYKLSFGGGSVVITDTTKPAITGANTICDGVHITVFLSKKMKCNSLAADGSDFVLSPPVAHVSNVRGNNCATGFDLDTVFLTLDKPLSPGKYKIIANTGSDGNTLLDICGNGIVPGEYADITIDPVIPTLMDSIKYAKCGSTKIYLYFNKPIYCNSVAANGSDFQISGPSTVTIINASPLSVITNPELQETFTTEIELSISTAIFTGGNYVLKLVNGTDGNTLIDECDRPIALNSVINLIVNQNVSAVFNYQIHLGCKMDSVSFSYDTANGVNKWWWTFDNTTTSTNRSNTLYYTTYGEKSATLVVTNGFCTDSYSIYYTLPTINLKAVIASNDKICPNDSLVFKDVSTGAITTWSWDFSNGQYSNLQNPLPQRYPPITTEREYPVRLTVTDSSGCVDVTYKLITLIPNCYIAVPSAFTPNGDGLNDYLYPLNAYKATNLLFRVYNRFGQLIFETKDWTHKWDGTFNRMQQPTGVYIWTLNYTDTSTNKPVALKGTTVLIR